MFTRRYVMQLAARLAEPRRFLQVVAGPRQVGKTTLVRQALEPLGNLSRYVTADEPTLRDREWIAQQWDAARIVARDVQAAGLHSGGSGTDGRVAVLALDEIQKIPAWSETVKRLWDEDTAAGLALHVVLLGSAPLLLQHGLTESLAGRFEMLHIPHWTMVEMRDAFGFELEQYLYFGGYPGAAPLAADPERWKRYIRDSLIETTISRDVLLLTRVDKPALMRQLFELACRYSGQVVSYQKMVGQLQDAGNTTTLAHYLKLLAAAGMVTGLQKFSGSAVRQRGSSPKLQVLNTALMTAQAGLSPEAVRADPTFRGRLVESAVGAHLANAAASGDFELFYWRAGDREVDFVIRCSERVTAIEVKSGSSSSKLPGMRAFTEAHDCDRRLLVGGDGIGLEEFLSRPATDWVA